MSQPGDPRDPHDEEPDRASASDDDLDEGGPGAVPHPLDRVWLHPTEYASVAGASEQPSAGTAAGRSASAWLVPLAAGAVGALVAVGVLAAGGILDDDGGSRDRPSASVDAAAPLVATVAPSLVAIVARDSSGVRRGSGVCVRENGDLLTNARLVGDAKEVRVTASDGSTWSADVIGVDVASDLAVVRVKDWKPKSARIAMRIADAGDAVWVLGAANAGGDDPWMSAGIVAAQDGVVAAEGGPWVSGVLVTDASATNASAGGALVDEQGMVAGIVLDRVGDADVSYAVPIDRALAIAEDLSAHGSVTHGQLGLAGVDRATGPTVVRVVPGGPAAKAGIRVDDVIVSVGGHSVLTMPEVTATVQSHEPGSKLALVVRRGGRERTVQVKLGPSTKQPATDEDPATTTTLVEAAG